MIEDMKRRANRIVFMSRRYPRSHLMPWMNVRQTAAAYIRSGIHAAIVGYGLVFIVLVIARLTIGERSSLIALANNVLPWLCWLGIALAAVGLLYPDRWLLVALHIPAVVVFGFAYGSHFLPRASQAMESGPAITAVVYNVCG